MDLLPNNVSYVACVGVDYESINLNGPVNSPKIIMASRETFSLWFYLGFWKNYAGQGKSKWRLPGFLKRKPWTSSLFWKDSFVTPFFKHIGCKLFGHAKKIAHVYDQQDRKGAMCPRCYRFPLRDKVKKLHIDQMPLYINDEDEVVREIATTRLKYPA